MKNSTKSTFLGGPMLIGPDGKPIGTVIHTLESPTNSTTLGERLLEHENAILKSRVDELERENIGLVQELQMKGFAYKTELDRLLAELNRQKQLNRDPKSLDSFKVITNIILKVTHPDKNQEYLNSLSEEQRHNYNEFVAFLLSQLKDKN